jgi:GH35 family endo-1,4-beta-xylanase
MISTGTRFLLVAVTLLSTASHTAAQYPAWVPDGFNRFSEGTAIRNTDRVDDLQVTGPGVATEAFAVSGQAFSHALRVTVDSPTRFVRDIRLRIPLNVAVQESGSFAIIFHARAGSGDYAQLDAVFETTDSPPARSLSKTAAPRSEWVQYVFTGTTNAGGESAFGFDLGAMRQTVEIGGIECIYFGQSLRQKKIDDFESHVYAGREADHPWRAQARDRIEKIRKADATIIVTGEGKPVSNASIDVAMREHAFDFSTAVQAPELVSGSGRYRDSLLSLFNKGGLENYLKWKNLYEPRIDTAVMAVDWMHEQGLRQRGHVLVWPSLEQHIPDWVSRDPATLAQEILDHIDKTVTLFKGKISEWDVINELYGHHSAVDLLGKPAMVDWFHAAHKADSACILYINDNNTIVKNDPAKRAFYHETVEYLLDNGAPLHGIGFQGHFREHRILSPLAVLSTLDEFMAHGLDLQITEFDIFTTDNALQADFTRDILLAMFSHPGIVGFQMWGFWQGAHRGSADHLNGYMYNLNWGPKPNAVAYTDLVFDTWWTNTSGTTDARGEFRFRGYKGAYDITVRHGGKSETFAVDLTADTRVRLDLDGQGQVVSASRPLRPRARFERTSKGLRITNGSRSARLRCSLVDVRGRRIRSAVVLPGKAHRFDAAGDGAGIYLLVIEADGTNREVYREFVTIR